MLQAAQFAGGENLSLPLLTWIYQVITKCSVGILHLVAVTLSYKKIA